MNVHHTVLKILRDKQMGKKASHHHEVYVRFSTSGKNRIAKGLRGLKSSSLQTEGWNARLLGKLEAASILLATDHQDQFHGQARFGLPMDEISQGGS